MRIIPTLIGSAAIWIGCAEAPAAAEIYRWVDADGVVHYSDEKPRDEAAFMTLEIEDTRPADYDPHADPYSIMNQAERINESWSALADARTRRIEEQRQVGQDVQLSQENTYRERINYGPRFYSPWLYSSLVPLNRPRVDQRTVSRQINAIESLNMAVPRPASINSGIHRARVERSTALPVSGAAPRRAIQ
jgi:hypothetical protein